MTALITLKDREGREVGRYTPKVARLLAQGGRFTVDYGEPPALWEPAGDPGRPIRVLGHVHRYPPVHNAGAEMMLHTLLRDLVRRGHEARVIATAGVPDPRPYDHEGVMLQLADRASEAYRWADVVLTHLDETKRAAVLAGGTVRPLVHLVHNDQQLSFNNVQPDTASLVVFNSQWLRKAVGWPGRQIVVRPAVMAEDYKTRRGKAITLINLGQEKGAATFSALAKRFPERPFLGVKGAYARQQVPRPVPLNMTVAEHTSDARSIYAQTRILLVPSSFESWGRVGIEAAASGIPVIAHPTPGLKESLGPGGIFVDRDDVDGWAAAIEALDDPAEYRRRSRLMLRRSADLDPQPDLDLFASALLATVAERAS